MFPFGFVVGAVTGAAAVLVLGPEVAHRARPIMKVALKAALMAMHEAQLRGAEVAEAAEDLFAEAKAEVTQEVFAAAMAAAQAKAAEQAARSNQAAGTKAATSKAARRRAEIRRSRVVTSSDE